MVVDGKEKQIEKKGTSAGVEGGGNKVNDVCVCINNTFVFVFVVVVVGRWGRGGGGRGEWDEGVVLDGEWVLDELLLLRKVSPISHLSSPFSFSFFFCFFSPWTATSTTGNWREISRKSIEELCTLLLKCAWVWKKFLLLLLLRLQIMLELAQ